MKGWTIDQEDSWDPWYMAFPAMAVLFGLLYVLLIIGGAILVGTGWLSLATYEFIAWIAFKYLSSAAVVSGAILALIEYHHEPYPARSLTELIHLEAVHPLPETTGAARLAK